MPNTEDMVLELHAQGHSIGQIAEELDIDAEEARSIVARQWAAEKEDILMRNRVTGRFGARSGFNPPTLPRP